MRTGEFRRHQYERVKEHRKHYWGFAHPDGLKGRQLGIVVNTRKPCSCYMCGNPRRHFDQLTMQEIKADERYGQQLREVMSQ